MANYVESFRSLNDFVDCINRRKPNHLFENRMASQTAGQEYWYGTASYSEAEKLLREGWTDVLDRIKNGTEQSYKMPMVNNRRNVPAVEGYMPHIPNYLMGHPFSMIKTVQIPQKVHAINLFYSIGVNYRISVERFIDAGIKVINLVNNLEQNNVRVNMKFMPISVSDNSNESAIVIVDLKNFNEHFNLLKMCFPMANVAMLRRLGFRYLETHPEITSQKMVPTYGYPMNSWSIEYTLKEKNLLGDNDLLISTEDMLNSNNYTIESVLKRFNIKQNVAA